MYTGAFDADASQQMLGYNPVRYIYVETLLTWHAVDNPVNHLLYFSGAYDIIQIICL